MLVVTVALGALAFVFLRRTKGPAPIPKGFVKVRDLKTKEERIIPQAELAPGMIQVRLHPTDEIVWVKAEGFNKGEYRHPPFSEEARDLLRTIKDRLDEVYPQTLEFWEDGFRRDQTAEREIALWLHLSKIYSEFAAETPRTIEEKKDAFKLLIGCSTATKETVLEVAKPTILDATITKRLIDAYYGQRQ
ncbi:MAG: hypothetical protein JWM68_1833 [Verrucomicrobiales bacterium]|nr:hypothetical protein [Verrucomicrobiales bacterium]